MTIHTEQEFYNFIGALQLNGAISDIEAKAMNDFINNLCECIGVNVYFKGDN